MMHGQKNIITLFSSSTDQLQ